MNWWTKTLFLMAIFLAVLLPLSSTYPDGLQHVALMLGVSESQPMWGGVLSEIQALNGQGGSSTAIAGALLGLGMTFLIGWLTASLLMKRVHK